MTGRGRTGRGGAGPGGTGPGAACRGRGDSRVPNSWGGGDVQPPRIKVNLPVRAEFSRPLHAVWSEDWDTQRVRGGGGQGGRAWHKGHRHHPRAPRAAGLGTHIQDRESRKFQPRLPERALESRASSAPLLHPVLSPNLLRDPSQPPTLPNNSWGPWRQRLLNFSRRGGPGTPFPWHRGTRVTAREIPGAPRPCGAPTHHTLSLRVAGIKPPRGLSSPRGPPTLNV